MQRRQFVTSASSTIAAASLAGCSGILGRGGSSGPEGTVEAYVDGVNDDDADTLQDVAHPEGNTSGTQVQDSDLEAISMRTESMEALDQSDGQATVEAEIETTLTMGSEETSGTQTIEFDVRKYEGEWLIYDDGWGLGPESTVEAYVDAVNDGDAEAIQDLAHPEGSDSGSDLSDSDLEGVSMRLESIETIEQSDGQVTVEADISVSMGGEETTETQTIEFDVHQHGGAWLIYDGGWSLAPESPVEAYVDAVNDNDAEAFQDLVHPEGSDSESDLSDSDMEGISMRIESIDTIEQSDGQATVEAVIEASASRGGEEMSATQAIEFDVRRYEGEWLIYGSTPVSGGS